MNIKGVFQIWMRDGSYHEIDLKECHARTRTGCKHRPDFAAEHADISLGGIGEDNDSPSPSCAPNSAKKSSPG